jgi:hypothetical protein
MCTHRVLELVLFQVLEHTHTHTHMYAPCTRTRSLPGT